MKTGFVKALSAFAAGSMAATLLVSSASAVTVSFSSTTAVTDTLPNPVIAYTSSGLNSVLTVGTPLTIPTFIGAQFGNNSFNSPGSFVITAAFTFTVPTPSGATTDTGSISATATDGKQVIIDWTDPVIFNFTDGTKLSVTLQDTTYNCLDSNCNNETFNIGGTFLVLNGPGGTLDALATPLPAALPLFATGLGALGLLGWRRKRKANLASAI
jgi:hypothetical protein